MSLTPFPHGIIATPNLGASAYGWVSTAKAIFVDKVNGSDSNDGRDPNQAKGTVEGALSVASACDVIYIAPGGAMDGGDPVAYRTAGATNHLIAATKYGLAMVGITAAGQRGFPMDPQIKIGSGITTPIITCYAPYCAFENLAFNTGGSTYYPALKFESGETATSNANNISVFNCYFRNAAGTSANGSTGGAITIIGGMGFNINHCMFYNCRTGISAKSGTDVCENLFIRDITFMASNANLISADIYMYFQGQNYTSISDIRICHDVPSVASGHAACIIAAGGAEVGLISGVFAMDQDGTMHSTTGTIVRVPNTMGTCFVYDGTGALQADEG